MGLTFHYKGRINKEASLTELITEVKEIAEVYDWNYRIYEEKLPTHL